jgi:hypothetical protein
VLQESGCPAVLIEAGFMSNQNDLAYLVTNDAKETFAKNILAAIRQYAAAQVHDVVNTTDNLHTPEKATAPLTGYESTTVPLSNSGIKTDGQVTVIDVPSKQGNADGPLYIVDQKEIGYGNAAKAELDLLVNPAQISVVNVLKDKNAVDKYGDKGKNGVIEIVTKKNGFETTMNEKKSNELVTTGNITLKLTNAANTPLYVVDYVKIGTGEEAAAKINKIPPASIESMNVLKGKNATDKYGDQGRNGVIEIITKKKLTLQQSKAGNMNEVTVTGYPSGKIENKINSVINPEMLKVNLNGIAKSRRDIKSIKDAALLLPDQEGANVISFDVYFSGAAFPAVLYVHGTGNNLRAVAGNQLDRLKDGSVMIFDNVKVQIADGSIVTATSPGYVFYEASKNTTSKSQGTLDLALKNSIEPVQNHIYSVPLKVHLKNGSEINTYSMVGNGTFAIKANLRCYLNGKLCNNPAAIKKEDVTYMESYDAGAAEKLLGVKGASEVLYISTRS